MLTPEVRNKELLKFNHTLRSSPDRMAFSNTLKTFKVSDGKAFAYQDSKADFDYFSLKPSNLMDLLYDQRPDVKF